MQYTLRGVTLTEEAGVPGQRGYIPHSTLQSPSAQRHCEAALREILPSVSYRTPQPPAPQPSPLSTRPTTTITTLSPDCATQPYLLVHGAARAWLSRSRALSLRFSLSLRAYVAALGATTTISATALPRVI
jgi:hypothetical protein